ncbi:MAG: hypothetical protein ACREB6_13400 [Rhodospirillales bacterium]
MRAILAVIVMAAFGLLAGCSLVPGVAQVEGAFVVGTEKTLEDHIISISSGKNCSSVRKEKGLTYCVEDEIQVKPKVYCYPTLGSPTCYDRPDPHQGRQQRLDENDHNMPK